MKALQNAKAEQLLARTLELKRKALGPGNPETLGTMDNLGTVDSDLGHYAKAEPTLVPALESFRRILGEGHHNMETSRRVVGAQHPDTLSEMLVLGRIRLLRRQQSEAVGLLRQTLASFEKTEADDAEPLLAAGWEGIRQHEGDLAAAERKYIRSTVDGARGSEQAARVCKCLPGRDRQGAVARSRNVADCGR